MRILLLGSAAARPLALPIFRATERHVDTLRLFGAYGEQKFALFALP